jgi:hypothetical protein
MTPPGDLVNQDDNLEKFLGLPEQHFTHSTGKGAMSLIPLIFSDIQMPFAAFP